VTDYAVEISFLAQRCKTTADARVQVREFLAHLDVEQLDGIIGTARVCETSDARVML
jgi:hypothetical protein